MTKQRHTGRALDRRSSRPLLPFSAALSRRLLFAAMAMLVSEAAGAATTITTVVNSDPAMCAQLLHMIKAAGIPEMTDEQLCAFDFAQLPAADTRGFTFPVWQKLDVADGPALYVKMLHANRAPGTVAKEPDYAKERQYAEEAARKGVLAFYTTQVPISAVTISASSPRPPTAGSDEWTIVSMRQTQCPSAMPKIVVGRYWKYSVFEQPELKTPVPINIAAGGTQVALWHGKLVLLYVSPVWVALAPLPTGISVELDNFWWAQGGDTFPNGMIGGTHCSFGIDKQVKESGR